MAHLAGELEAGAAPRTVISLGKEDEHPRGGRPAIGGEVADARPSQVVEVGWRVSGSLVGGASAVLESSTLRRIVLRRAPCSYRVR